MEQKPKDEALSQWISTYGLVTVERILAGYNIVLSQAELVEMVKNPANFYYQLIRIPLKNVLSGIIIQQAHDFHVYVQKLFIDYLLSGESAKTKNESGSDIREQIEDERMGLIISGEEFQEFQEAHNRLIGKSQRQLITTTAQWNKTVERLLATYNSLLTQAGFTVKKSELRHALQHAVIHSQLQDARLSENFLALMNAQLNQPISAQLNDRAATELTELLEMVTNFHTNHHDFIEQSIEHHRQSVAYRRLFQDAIIKVTTLIGYLSEYRIDAMQDELNRDLLQFDSSLGEL